MPGVRMTGAEYKAFTGFEWGPDWYWDETAFLHNDVEKDDIGEVDDTDVIVILAATIYKGQEANSEAIDGVRFARAWLKKRNSTSLIIEVPNPVLDSVKALLKGVKGVRIV
jgi:hypothetical protein